MVQFLPIIFFLGFLQFLLGFSKVPVFFVSPCIKRPNWHLTSTERRFAVCQLKESEGGRLWRRENKLTTFSPYQATTAVCGAGIRAHDLQTSRSSCDMVIPRKRLGRNTDDLGYNDFGSCDTTAINLYILFPHKARVFLPCLVRHSYQHLPRI